MSLFPPTFSEQLIVSVISILPFLDAILATLWFIPLIQHSVSVLLLPIDLNATNCSYLIIGSLGQRSSNIMKTKEKQKALQCMGIKAYMHQHWLNITITDGIQRDKCFFIVSLKYRIRDLKWKMKKPQQQQQPET